MSPHYTYSYFWIQHKNCVLWFYCLCVYIKHLKEYKSWQSETAKVDKLTDISGTILHEIMWNFWKHTSISPHTYNSAPPLKSAKSGLILKVSLYCPSVSRGTSVRISALLRLQKHTGMRHIISLDISGWNRLFFTLDCVFPLSHSHWMDGLNLRFMHLNSIYIFNVTFSQF